MLKLIWRAWVRETCILLKRLSFQYILFAMKWIIKIFGWGLIATSTIKQLNEGQKRREAERYRDGESLPCLSGVYTHLT